MYVLKYKWLSPDGDGTGAGTSATDAAQDNGGTGGQGAPDPRIKQLSDENAAHRNKNKVLAEQVAKLTADLEAATGKLTASEVQTGVERALISAALRAKFNDPEDALKYVDMAEIMKLDADKRKSAITEVLNKVATDKPWLVQPAPTTGTDGKKPVASPANPADNKPGLTLDEIKGMSREQLAERKDEVFRVLKTSGGS